MKLNEYLEAKNLSPSAFAAQAELPPSTIIRLLKGERRDTSMRVLARIAEASEGAVLPNDFLASFTTSEAAQ